jgi:DNA-binding phage protein
MTVQNSQRSKEYLETAQTLLRAAKTMTDLATAAALSSEGFVPARSQSPDLRSCSTKVATTSQFDWRKACRYGNPKARI